MSGQIKQKIVKLSNSKKLDTDLDLEKLDFDLDSVNSEKLHLV